MLLGLRGQQIPVFLHPGQLGFQVAHSLLEAAYI